MKLKLNVKFGRFNLYEKSLSDIDDTSTPDVQKMIESQSRRNIDHNATAVKGKTLKKKVQR